MLSLCKFHIKASKIVRLNSARSLNFFSWHRIKRTWWVCGSSSRYSTSWFASCGVQSQYRPFPIPQTRGKDLLIKYRNLQLSQAINIRKETNNQAILIFTVVTVIFLPLSFVTSYLGMNSIDIRNGNFEQTLFWELSVPLAVIVMTAIWFIVRFKRSLRRKLNGLVRRLSLMFGRRQQRVSFLSWV